MQKASIFNYSFQNNKTSCDVYIDGTIVDVETKDLYTMYYSEDIAVLSSKSLRNEIDGYIRGGCTTVNAYINSQGGNVFEAMNIHDYFVELENKGITINRIGRGVVASSGTYLLCGKNSKITANTTFIIHDVSGGIYGNVSEVESYAVALRTVNNHIASFYSTTTGKTVEEIGNMMKVETYMVGQDAVDNGFVESLYEGPNQNFTNSIKPEQWLFKNQTALSIYNSFTIKNKNNMDFKKMGEDLKNNILQHMRDIGVIKNDTDVKPLDGLPAIIENLLKPLGAELDTQVTNAVTEATKDLPTVIENAVKKVLENLAAKTDLENLATKQSVTDEVKKVSDELELVKASIANNKGGEAGGGKGGNDTIDRTGISFTGTK